MNRQSAYPDVYFTPGYGSAARDEDFASWRSICRLDGRWQMPLVIRHAPDGALDAASPYGYSGIYASPELSAKEVAEAWRSSIAELRDLGVISVFLRHSPLVAQPAAHPDQIFLVDDHPTVAVQTREPDQIWAGLDSSCRNKVRKAIRAGMTASVRTATAADLTGDGPFRLLYEETMRRLDASEFYFFDDNYFGRLLNALGDDLHLAEVVDSDGHVVAACLLMSHGEFLHYHLAGSAHEGARAGANNLMLWEACRFAAERGSQVFHLGGGISADDPLHRFKRSFGGDRVSYRTSGLILDPTRYRELCPPGHSPNFFPEYRARTA